MQPLFLFLAWQDSQNRSWYPIGKLIFREDKYTFCYVKGAIDAQREGGFKPIPPFIEYNKTYVSKKLFSIFSTRLLSPSRPDFEDFVSWLGLQPDERDPIVLLARSGGHRVTDRLEVFPLPTASPDGVYHASFFAHGLRYIPKETTETKINKLKKGDKLFIAHEFQNPYDRYALTLLTEDHWQIGYCPRYLLNDVALELAKAPDAIDIKVERDADASIPLQFRLLCKMTARWPEGANPFEKDKYKPIKEGCIEKI